MFREKEEHIAKQKFKQTKIKFARVSLSLLLVFSMLISPFAPIFGVRNEVKATATPPNIVQNQIGVWFTGVDGNVLTNENFLNGGDGSNMAITMVVNFPETVDPGTEKKVTVKLGSFLRFKDTGVNDINAVRDFDDPKKIEKTLRFTDVLKTEDKEYINLSDETYSNRFLKDKQEIVYTFKSGVGTTKVPMVIQTQPDVNIKDLYAEYKEYSQTTGYGIENTLPLFAEAEVTISGLSNKAEATVPKIVVPNYKQSNSKDIIFTFMNNNEYLSINRRTFNLQTNIGAVANGSRSRNYFEDFFFNLYLDSRFKDLTIDNINSNLKDKGILKIKKIDGEFLKDGVNYTKYEISMDTTKKFSAKSAFIFYKISLKDDFAPEQDLTLKLFTDEVRVKYRNLETLYEGKKNPGQSFPNGSFSDSREVYYYDLNLEGEQIALFGNKPGATDVKYSLPVNSEEISYSENGDIYETVATTGFDSFASNVGTEDSKPKELVMEFPENENFEVKGFRVPIIKHIGQASNPNFSISSIKVFSKNNPEGKNVTFERPITRLNNPEYLSVRELGLREDDVLTKVIIPIGILEKEKAYVYQSYQKMANILGKRLIKLKNTRLDTIVATFEIRDEDFYNQPVETRKTTGKANITYYYDSISGANIRTQISLKYPSIPERSQEINGQNITVPVNTIFPNVKTPIKYIINGVNKTGEHHWPGNITRVKKIHFILPEYVELNENDISLEKHLYRFTSNLTFDMKFNNMTFDPKEIDVNKYEVSTKSLGNGLKVYTITFKLDSDLESLIGFYYDKEAKLFATNNIYLNANIVSNVAEEEVFSLDETLFVEAETGNVVYGDARNSIDPHNLFDGDDRYLFTPLKTDQTINFAKSKNIDLRVEVKKEDQDDSSFKTTEESYPLTSNSDTIVGRFNLDNNLDTRVKNLKLFIPIPKKGQYWGQHFQKTTDVFNYGFRLDGVEIGNLKETEFKKYFDIDYTTVPDEILKVGQEARDTNNLRAQGEDGTGPDTGLVYSTSPTRDHNLIRIRVKNPEGEGFPSKSKYPLLIKLTPLELKDENDGQEVAWNSYFNISYEDGRSGFEKSQSFRVQSSLGKVAVELFGDDDKNGIKLVGENRYSKDEYNNYKIELFKDNKKVEVFEENIELYKNGVERYIVKGLLSGQEYKLKVSSKNPTFAETQRFTTGEVSKDNLSTIFTLTASKVAPSDLIGSSEALVGITGSKTQVEYVSGAEGSIAVGAEREEKFFNDKLGAPEVVAKTGYRFIGYRELALPNGEKTNRTYSVQELLQEDVGKKARKFQAEYIKEKVMLIAKIKTNEFEEEKNPTLKLDLYKESEGSPKTLVMSKELKAGQSKSFKEEGFDKYDENGKEIKYTVEVDVAGMVAEEQAKYAKFISEQKPVDKKETEENKIPNSHRKLSFQAENIPGTTNQYAITVSTDSYEFDLNNSKKTEGLGKIERLKYLEEGVEGDSVGSGTKAGYKSEVLSKNTEAEIAEVVKAAEAKNLENRKDQVEKEINKLEYLPEGPVAGDNNDKADFISRVKSPDASLEQVEAALEEAKAKNNTLTGDVKAKVSEANSQIDSVLRDLESGDENTEGTKEYYKKALKEAKTPEKVDEILTAAKEKDFANKKAKLKKAIEDAGLTNQGEKNRLLELVRNATFDVDSAKDRYTEDADKNKGLLFAIESQLKDAINVQAADQLGALKLKYERIKDKLDPSKQSEWDSLSKTLPIDYSALNKILNDGAVKFVNENKSDFEGSLPNLDSLSEGDKNTFTGKLNDMVTGLPQTDLPKEDALHQNTDSYDALVKKVDDVKQAYDALADKHKQALGVAKDAGRKEVTNLAPSGASDILDAINDATKVAEVEKQVAKAKFLKEKEKALEEIANYPNNENKKIKALKAQITAESVSEPPVATKEQFEAAKANVEAKINEAKALNEAIEEAVKVLVEAKKGTTDAVSPEQARELFKDAETAAQVLEVLTGKGVEFKNPTNSTISQVLSGIRDGSISGTEAIEKFKEAIALDKRIEEGKKEIKASGVKDPKKAELLEKVSQANSISDVETDVIEAKANALENLTNATIKSKLDELKAINQKPSEASEDLENAKSALQFATNLDNAIKDGVRALDEINSQTPIEGISEKKVEIRAAQTVKEVLEKLVDSLPDIDGSSVEQMAGLKAIKDSIGSANEEGAKAKLDEAIKLHKAIREGIEAINAIKDLPNKSELKNQIKNLSDPEMIRSLVNETKTAQGLKEAKEALKELVKHKGLTSPTDSDIDGLSSLEEIVNKLKEVATQPPVDNTVQELVNKIDDIVSDNNKTPTEKSQEVAKESKKIADRVKDIIDAEKAQEKVADTGKAIIDETYPALTNADDVKQQIDNLPSPKDPKSVADIIKNNLPIAKSPIDNAKVNEIFDDINNINTDPTKTPEQKKAEIQAKLEELKELNKGISDEVKKVDEDVQPFKDMSESEKNSIKEKIQKAKTPEEAQEIFNSEKADAVIANTGKVETATPHVKDAIDNLSDLSPLEKEDFKKRVDGTSPYSKPQTVEELNNILEAAKAKNLENKKAKAKLEIEAIMDAVNNIIEPDVDNAKLKELLADIANPATNAEEAAAKIEEAKKLAEAIKDVVTEVKDLGTEYVNPPKSNDLVNKLNALTDSDTANIKNTVLGPVKDAIVTAEQEKAKDEVEGLKSIAEQPVNTHVQALLDKINNPEGSTPEEKLENVKKALEEAKALDEKINDIVGKLDTDEFKNLTESEKNTIKADIKENSTPDNIAKKINDAVIKNATNSGKVEEAKAAAKKEVQAMEALKAVDPTEHARVLQAIEDATTPEVVKGLLEEARAKNELAKLGADEYNTAKSSIDGITPKPGEAGFDPDAYKNALAEKVLDAAKTKATKDVEAEIAKLPEGVTNDKLNEIKNSIAGLGTPDEVKQKVEEAKALVEALKDAVEKVNALPTTDPTVAVDLDTLKANLNGVSTSEEAEQKMKEAKKAHADAIKAKIEEEIGNLNSTNPGVNAYLDKVKAVNPQVDTADADIQKLKEEFENAKKLDSKIKDLDNILNSPIFNTLTEAQKQAIKDDIKNNAGSLADFDAKIEEAKQAASIAQGKVEEAKAAAKKEVQAMEALKAVDPTEHARVLQAIEDATTPEVVKGLLEEARAKNELAKLGADEYNTAKSSIDGITPKPGEAGFDPDAYKNALAEKVLDAAKTKATKDVEAEIAKLPEGVTNDKLNEIKNSIAGLGTPDEVKQKVEEAKALVEALKDAVEKVNALPTTDPTVAVDLDTLKANLNGVSTPEEAEQKMKEAKKAHAEKVKNKAKSDIEGFGKPNNRGIQEAMELLDDINTNNQSGDESIKQAREILEKAKKLNDVLNKLDEEFETDVFKGLTPEKKTELKNNILTYATNVEDVAKMLHNAKGNSEGKEETVEEMKEKGPKDIDSMKGLANVSPTESQTLKDKLSNANTIEEAKAVLAEAHAKNVVGSLEDPAKSEALQKVNEAVNKFESSPKNKADVDALNRELAEAVKDAAKAQVDAYLDVAPLNEEPKVTNQRLEEIKAEIADTNTTVEQINAKLEEAKKLADAMKKAVEEQNSLEKEEPMNAELAKKVRDSLKADLANANTLEDVFNKGLKAQQFAEAITKALKKEEEIKATGLDENNEVSNDLLEKLKNATDKAAVEVAIADAKSALTDKAKNKLIELANQVDPAVKPTVLTDKINALQGEPSNVKEGFDEIKAFIEKVKEFEAATIDKLSPEAQEDLKSKVKAAQSEERVKDLIEEAKAKQNALTDFENGADNLDILTDEVKNKWIGEIEKANSAEEANLMLSKAKQEAKFEKGSFEEAKPLTQEIINSLEGLTDKDKQDLVAETEDAATTTKLELKAILEKAKVIAELRKVEPKLDEALIDEIKAQKFEDTGAADNTLEQFKEKLTAAVIEKSKDAIDKANEVNTQNPNDALKAELDKIVPGNNAADVARAIAKANELANKVEKSVDLIKSLHDGYELSDAVKELIKNAVVEDDFNNAVREAAKEEVENVGLVKDEDKQAVKSTVDKLTPKEAVDFVKAIKKGVDSIEEEPLKALRDEQKADLMTNIAGQPNAEAVDNIVEAIKNAMTEINGNNEPYNKLTAHEKRGYLDELVKTNTPELVNALLEKIKKAVAEREEGFNGGYAYGELTQAINSAIDEVNSFENLKPEQKAELIENIKKATTAEEIVKILEEARKLNKEASSDQWPDGLADGIRMQIIDGEKYFYNKEGKLLKGWIKYDGHWYLLSFENGKALKGWNKYYDRWFYLDPKTAKMHTGWLKYNNNWYYLNPENGDMAVNWKKVDGKWYLLDGKNGNMKTGWHQVNGKWYYLNAPNGDMALGWINQNGKWYFLDWHNGDMKTGWKYISGKWYLLNNSGVMLQGWQLSEDKWYFLDKETGEMRTGWIKVDGKWYFLDKYGAMANSDRVVENIARKFATSGEWLGDR